MGWLLGVCLLVGCADRNSGRMSEEEAEAAVRPWLDCVSARLRAIDDGSASSTVVAYAIRAECHRFWLGSPGLELPLLVDTVAESRALRRNQSTAARSPVRDHRPQSRGSISSTPMKKGRGTYVVPVTINDAITLDFTVDSGASDVTIPIDVVKTLIRAGTIRDTDVIGKKTYVLADGSKVKSLTFRIRSLKVGDRVVQNVVGSVAPASGTLLLGQSFLGRFKSWSIDNSRHALVLE
jgi:clan AA aspartic protease (TIGR02281 family)